MSAEYIVEIDAGNTASKWRLLIHAEVIAAGVTNCENSASTIGSALENISGSVRARVVTVAGQESSVRIKDMLNSLGINQIGFASVVSPTAGVVCAYQDLQQLGVDRWMAVLAAANEFSSPLVIADFGTALTVDFIAADKQHLGGYIVPGWGLMRSVLLRETSIDGDHIPADYNPPSIDCGRTTKDAIGMGRLHALTAIVERSVTDFADSLKSEVRLVCTGGDAPRVIPHMRLSAHYRADLVLDGLALALD